MAGGFDPSNWNVTGYGNPNAQPFGPLGFGGNPGPTVHAPGYIPAGGTIGDTQAPSAGGTPQMGGIGAPASDPAQGFNSTPSTPQPTGAAPGAIPAGYQLGSDGSLSPQAAPTFADMLSQTGLPRQFLDALSGNRSRLFNTMMGAGGWQSSGSGGWPSPMGGSY